VPAADFLSFTDPPPPLGDFELMVLDRMLRSSPSLDALRLAVARRPEDPARNGIVGPGFAAFLEPFGTREAVIAAVEAEFDRRGGRDALDGMRDGMEFDEFLDGWKT
jgi:hypothetical protein